jgi:hypothetical protein
LPRAVAAARSARSGPSRTVPRVLAKLAARLSKGGRRLSFCYEAGPCGYGLHRLPTDWGHEWVVVAPSLIPIKASDRVKTDRRDALVLATLHRAGDRAPRMKPCAIWCGATGIIEDGDSICRIYRGDRAWTLDYRRRLTTVHSRRPECGCPARAANPSDRGAAAKLINGTHRSGASGDAGLPECLRGHRPRSETFDGSPLRNSRWPISAWHLRNICPAPASGVAASLLSPAMCCVLAKT